MKAKHEIAIRIIKGFYEILNTIFDDFDKKTIAQRYIQKLRQANRPFYQYLANFEVHINNIDYDEENQRFAFKKDLSSELRALLIFIDASLLLFDALKKLCQRMNSE